jgi:hypothetical protein
MRFLDIDFPVQIRSGFQNVLKLILAPIALPGTSGHFRLSSRFSGVLAGIYPSRIFEGVRAESRTTPLCSARTVLQRHPLL